MTDVTISISDLQSAVSGLTLKTVAIQGQLDESNVDEKIKDIYKVIEANPKNLGLLFDLEGLTYMNSKSIGYLTDIYGKIAENGGSVAIAKARPNILDILQVVGLTQLIPTLDSSDQAKTKLESDFSQKTGATTNATAPTATTPAASPAPEAPQATDTSTFKL